MSEAIEFTSNGKSISAELFKPGGAGAKDGVIIIAHGTDELLEPWGVQIRQYAEALAEKGFIALIPRYFLSTETAPGFRDLEPIFQHRLTWQQAVADAVARAMALPGADSSRVGLLGFSLGGHLCLRLRAMAKVLVEFFGPALDLEPMNTNKLFAQVHHGTEDKVVEFESNFGPITEILKKEGAVCDFHSYPGAGHGFIGTEPANTNAKKESRERTLAFFESHL